MTTPSLGAYCALVDQFEAAVREHEIMGMRDPSDHAQIELEYREAKQTLLDAPDEAATWLDRCAWAAMQALTGDGWEGFEQPAQNAAKIAELSYDIAAAMLAEKRKREGAA